MDLSKPPGLEMSSHLQDLNISKMLIQFYTKFGIEEDLAKI